jgi:hypothetical protein
MYPPNRAPDMCARGIVHVQRRACSTPTTHVSMSTTERYYPRCPAKSIADSDDLAEVSQRHVLATDLTFGLRSRSRYEHSHAHALAPMPRRTAIHKWNTAQLLRIHACMLHVRTCTDIIVAVSLLFTCGCLARHGLRREMTACLVHGGDCELLVSRFL